MYCLISYIFFRIIVLFMKDIYLNACEEDVLFDEAVRTPCPPGTEDDVEMRSPGGMDDLEAARRYLDEDEDIL